MQQGLESLSSLAPQARAGGVGPGGAALQTRHALGIERVHDIARGLVAAPHLARNSWHPGAILAGQHDLAAPHEKGIGGSNSRLRVKARKLGVGAPEFLRFARL